MPQGTQLAVITPGTNAKHSLAGGLDLGTGALHDRLGAWKTNGLVRELLQTLDEAYPPTQCQRVYGVVDNYTIHKAKAVEQWLATHPWVTLLFLPTCCPCANPIQRAFGDVHACWPRDHRRTRLPDLLADVEAYLHVNGPWAHKLSALYDEAAATMAVEKIAAQE
jgi:hypothetical protein